MSQYERIRQIVAENLGVSVDLVIPEASFVHDLGASLDIVEMVMECEEEFGISIPDKDAAQLVTVRQLATYIALKTKPDEEGTVWPPPPAVN